jgi:predicted permease
MQTLFQDLKFSLRTLSKSPGFTLTAVFTLALGIGSVTSIFSIVNAVLLKPFSFAEPERLVSLRETTRERTTPLLPDNYQHYLYWKANAKTLADAAIFRNTTLSVSSGVDHPEVVGTLAVSANFFSVLGIQPALGRGFQPQEATEGNNEVVVLAWSAWQRYFNGDRDAIGRTLRIGGAPHTVVGVLPQGFTFPHMSEMPSPVSQRVVLASEIFRPLLPDPSPYGDHNFLVIGRLRDGVTLAQAQAELGSLQQARARTDTHMDSWVSVAPLQQEVAGGVSRALWMLLAAVGAVLLIGCVNLANLQMARTVAREREFAVRLALGAERGRLIVSTLMDSAVLAVAGGALGVLLSFASLRLLVSLAPANLPRLNETHVSWPVLLVAAGLAILTALFFGLLPALRSMRVDPQTAMQSNSSRVANAREGQRTRHLLVAGEVACTVVLLIVTGLLIRSFSRLMTQQRDFDSGHVSLVQVNLSPSQYKQEAGRAAFLDRTLATLEQIPGVQSVATTSEMPMGGETWVDSIFRPDHAVPVGKEPAANMRWVSPSYASTLKIPVVAGRDLQASDREHPGNALISQQTARTIWEGEDALGKTFTVGRNTTFTVVGVVADARINDLKKTVNMVYLPYWQNPWFRAYFLVRSPQPAAALADSLRRAIWSVDPEVAIPNLVALDEQVNGSVATERFQATLLSSFGAAALLLALLGVYGVLAYSVSLRQQEFGIRVALGSTKAALMRLVVSQAMVPIGGGIAVGLALAFAATRWVQSMLYETKAVDAGVIAASVAVLLMTAFVAALIPARRAASIDPMQALRTE